MIRLFTFFERFIPEHLKTNPADIMRAYITVGTLISYIIVSILVILAMLAFTHLSGIAVVIAYIYIFSCTLVYSSALVIFSKTGNFRLSGNMTVTIIFLVITTSVNLSGGYQISPIGQLMILVPVLAFLLAGRLDGVRWIVVSLITTTVLYFMDQFDILVFQLVSDQTLLEASAAVLQNIMIVMACGAMFIYELINESLKNKLDFERSKFEHKASHDSLTGIANRFEFFRRIKSGLNDCKNREQRLAVVYIDLDGFKPVNDTYGHHAGDILLKEIARRLGLVLRVSDTVARLGGDEFSLILLGIHLPEDIVRIMDKVQATISEPIDIGDGKMVTVHASSGVSIYPDHSHDIDDLCRFADVTMYKAKEQHNTYVVFNDEIGKSLNEDSSENFREKTRVI
ncbi:MAG: diguanylate cyclase [Pseudomonadales bacterium]|nr:diguanylate cyclase [Pseudomonadales bacterium]